MVLELLSGGGLGPDLSASFTFTIEGGNVLRIEEVGAVLNHRTWYAILNTGAWSSVAPFEVDYLLQIGDENDDGAAAFNDLSLINAGIPNFFAPDDDRRDIDGDRRILNVDLSVASASMTSFPVVKPTGHACAP